MVEGAEPLAEKALLAMFCVVGTTGFLRPKPWDSESDDQATEEKGRVVLLLLLEKSKPKLRAV